MPNENWSLANLPPEGHNDVGAFFYSLFSDAKNEKERLKIPQKMSANYKLYRGNHFGQKVKKNSVSINLFFANVQRTVANITARNPTAEAVDLGSENKEASKVATAKLRKWWQDTGQHAKLRLASQRNEKYGFVVAKPYWDARLQSPNQTVLDGYSYFPAPGYFEDPSVDAPYICQAYAENTEIVKKMFKVEEDVQAGETYTLLGKDREGLRPAVPEDLLHGVISDPALSGGITAPTGSSVTGEDALIIEIWIHDSRTETTKGSEGKDIESPVYKDGVRCVTITNDGGLVLRDRANPNMNWELELEQIEGCYLFGKLPFFLQNSYIDSTSNWGFSAAEQTYQLIAKIDELISRLIAHIQRSMSGVLICPKNNGISNGEITNRPGLVLRPDNNRSSQYIRFLQQPSLPSDFFQAFNLLVQMFDRVYSIQDIDRGDKPSGVTAAAAIVAMQERNAVLIQHKINTIDDLVERGGNAAISLLQNHGHQEEQVEIDGESVSFIGRSLLGKKFNYIVEAGSTMPKTSLQLEDQANGLFDKGVIDGKALLETLNFPGWQTIHERMGESQLDAALNVLVQAGLNEEEARQLKVFLMQPQSEPKEAVNA